MHGTDSPDKSIWNSAHRKAVARLHGQVDGQLSLQTCHFWFVYESYNEKAAAKTIARIAAGQVIDVNDKIDTTHAIGCSALPVEILQLICSFLQVKELKVVRLANKQFSDIAAEFLINDLWLDTNFESFKQLKYIVKHPNLRKGVRRLIFEAGLQSDIGCIHHYKRHYELPHHGKPSPPDEKSGRTARLYARNLDKFERETEAKFAIYRQTFESQQLLVNEFRDILYPTTQGFQNLKEIRFHCGSICPHNFSEKFRQRYTKDCAVLQSDDPSPTVWQLERLIKPGLTHLHMSQISPQFFNGEGIRDQKWLRHNFASIEKVNIGFRQDWYHGNIATVVDPEECVLRSGTLLPYALQHATNLNYLQVNFMPHVRVSAAKLESIMPNISFEKLTRLDLDFFTAKADDLMRILKAQPKLYWLALSNVKLSQGKWRATCIKMRTQLRLEEFMVNGYLEDSSTRYMMNWCNQMYWAVKGVKYTLAMALDHEVTDHEELSPEEAGDSSVDGIERVSALDGYGQNFQDPEQLLEDYGDLDREIDDDIDMTATPPGFGLWGFYGTFDDDIDIDEMLSIDASSDSDDGDDELSDSEDEAMDVD